MTAEVDGSRYVPVETAQRITGHGSAAAFRRWAEDRGVRCFRRGGSNRLLFREEDVVAAHHAPRRRSSEQDSEA